ncbi:MAG: 4-alpha-glucanotransferase [Chloroflexi bacterium]|nr:4-alpha-glucanotransferase [Chloroflexota bacterium]
MKFNRSSGILLHPTSLPGPYGIGDLGPAAHGWADWLSGAGCKLWQALPLGPTGYGDSPYQCFSAFAGNPYLVSPDLLLRDGLLHANDLVERMDFDPRRVDYGRIIPWKLNLLERAFSRFKAVFQQDETLREAHAAFCAENAAWLDDYALFMAIKEAHGGGAWDGWPEPLRRRDPVTLEAARRSLEDAISRYKFYQFIFFRQWRELRDHVHQRGLRIIGDAPIFVAMDSSDVWAHPDLFFLDADGKPTVVAGVPPDYFSPTGQLWGNPLYRWDVHKKDGYAWWLERLRFTLETVDIVRIDHFRGFAGYWEIPAGSPTAETGRWAPGPGADLFNAIRASLGADLPIIAEDLGLITPDVTALRDQFELPGMKILQFAFSGPDNPFLPHQYPQNCVVYSGTHDNDTANGWYASAPEVEKDFARRYLGVDGSDFAWDLVRAAWSSTAVFALAPMQDLLDLGTEARFNFPSRLGGNWEWRMMENDLGGALQDRLREMNWLYRRLSEHPAGNYPDN